MKTSIRLSRRALWWLSLATLATSLTPIGAAWAQAPIDREALAKALTFKLAAKDGVLADDQDSRAVAEVAKTFVNATAESDLVTLQDFIQRGYFLIIFNPTESGLQENYNFDEAASDQIALIADMAIEFQARKVMVVGHSDTAVEYAFSMRISERRGKATADQLVKAGVDQSIITVDWKGKTDLVAQTADGVDDPRNRSAAIFVTL